MIILSETNHRSRRGKFLSEEVSAFDCLIEDAEACMLQNTESLLDKQHVPPSGDKRDYFSLSVYFRPNLETADGLPYAPGDGDGKYLQAIKRLPGVPVESRYHLLYPVSKMGP